MAKKITNKLIQLPPEVSIDRVIDHPHSLELFLSYPEQPRRCPSCGSSDCVIKDSGRNLTVRHVSVAGRGSFLSFHGPRLRCKRCGAPFSMRPYFVHPALKLSVSAWLSVSAALMTTRSLRDIAVDNCLTESQVLSVLRAVDFPKPDLLPQTLCIDGFKGSSGVYDKDSGPWNINRFHCNISDGSIGCIVDVLPRMDPEYLPACFRDYSPQQRRRVLFFCCDMHGGFISFAKRRFPDVRVCIDMFHVVRLLNDNVSEIRRALQKAFRSDSDEISCQILKRSARLLTTSVTNQGQYWKDSFSLKSGLLEHALSLSDDLREAYEALMGFHIIPEWSAYSVQRVMLTGWPDTYTSSAHKGTRRCANTIRHYRSCIRNSWKYGRSNGPCEGLNNKIRILRRNCYGVHDFDNFRFS